MLTLAQLRADPDDAKARLARRGDDLAHLVDEALRLDDRRKALQTEHDGVLRESNRASREIGALMGQGKKEEAEAAKARTGELKHRSRELAAQQQEVGAELERTLLAIPNLPHESVPAGSSEEDNELIRSRGEKPSLHEGAKPHWELAADLDVIDLPLGVKLAGAGFPVYKGAGARLQRALSWFFLDRARAAKYTEYAPSLLVNEASGYGTGQLPDKEGQMYKLAEDELYLVPTAEVPLTNMYRDTILPEEDLPVRMTAFTACFRREAGSYGADVRGLNRLHQFEKVEIVQIAHPDRSYEVLEEMVSYVETLVQALELPYRIVRLCGGDLGFAAAMTYDFEVWSAAQEKWLEISSVSNFETFQSNRLKLRFTDSSGHNRLAHTLNGSALAFSRVVAALLENHQTPRGVVVPEALRKYTGFDRIG